MPYIITTTQSLETDVYGATDTVTAVATPDDARRAIIAIGETHGAWIGGDALHGPIDRNGGTVGPLPDGTVIEVAQVTPARLAELAGTTSHLQSGQAKLTSLIVAAFNAR